MSETATDPNTPDLYMQAVDRPKRKMERVRLEVSIRVFFDSMGYHPTDTERLTLEAMQKIDEMVAASK